MKFLVVLMEVQSTVLLRSSVGEASPDKSDGYGTILGVACGSQAQEVVMTVQGDGVACYSNRSQKKLRSWIVGSSLVQFVSPAVWDSLSQKYYAALKAPTGKHTLTNWSIDNTIHLKDLPKEAVSPVHSLHPLGLSRGLQQRKSTQGPETGHGGVISVFQDASIAIFNSSLNITASMDSMKGRTVEAVSFVHLENHVHGGPLKAEGSQLWRLAVIVGDRGGPVSGKEVRKTVELYGGEASGGQDVAQEGNGKTSRLEHLGTIVLEGGGERGSILAASFSELGHLSVFWANGTWSVHKLAAWSVPEGSGLDLFSRKLGAFNVTQNSPVTPNVKSSKRRHKDTDAIPVVDFNHSAVALISIPGTAYVAAVGRVTQRDENKTETIAETMAGKRPSRETVAVAVLDTNYGCVHLFHYLLEEEERDLFADGVIGNVNACWMGEENGGLAVSSGISVVRVELKLPLLSLAGLLGAMRFTEKGEGMASQAAEASSLLLTPEESKRLSTPPSSSVPRVRLIEKWKSSEKQQVSENTLEKKELDGNGAGDSRAEMTEEEDGRMEEETATGIAGNTGITQSTNKEGERRVQKKRGKQKGKAKVHVGKEEEVSNPTVWVMRRDDLWDEGEVGVCEQRDASLVAEVNCFPDGTSVEDFTKSIQSYIRKHRTNSEGEELVNDKTENGDKGEGRESSVNGKKDEDDSESDAEVKTRENGIDRLGKKKTPKKIQKSKHESPRKLIKQAALLMSPNLVATVAMKCIQLKFWDLLLALVEESPLTAMNCPSLISEAVKSHQLRILVRVLLQWTDIPPSGLSLAVSFLLSLGNHNEDVYVKEIVTEKKIIAKAALRAASKEKRQKQENQKEETGKELAIFTGNKGTFLSSTDKVEGGKKELITERLAIVAAAAMDGFSPRELCFHSLVSVNRDESVLTKVIQELSASEVLVFVKYFRKWMEKYTGRLGVYLSYREFPTVWRYSFPIPSLQQIAVWSGLLFDCHLSQLVHLSECFEDLLKLQECVSRHSEASWQLASMGGMLSHIRRGISLGAVHERKNKMYSVELLDWS